MVDVADPKRGVEDDLVAFQSHVTVEGADQPYPGLRSFRRDEAHIFFGREGTINAMVDRLAGYRFLAVTGASGSGKSSLVRTGLLDALDRGVLAEAGPDWFIVDFRPGNQPLTAMASALLKTSKDRIDNDQWAIVEARLAQGPSALPALLDDLDVPDGVNVLLLVDQFEEVFRYRQNDEADAFVALLLASTAQRRRRIYGVITMRSDFLGECSRFPGLAEAINQSQFLAPRLTRPQLREAIEGPAAVYGGKVEPALVAQLLNDIGSDPDQLPLMQHVLLLMWQEAANGGPDSPILLTLQHYRELGGIASGSKGPAGATDGEPMLPAGSGALSVHLDRLLARLSPSQQRLAEVLFRTLVDSEGVIGRDVRRPTSLCEIAMVAGVSSQELISVVEEFRAPGRNFLTPPHPVPLAPETVIDISHESLIRQWRTLRRWLNAELMSVTEYRRIAATAALWQRREEGRLRMPYLGVARQWRERERPNPAWAARYGGDFDLSIRFLEHSVVRNRLHKGMGWLALALLFGVIGVFGFEQYQRAETSAMKLSVAQGELQLQRQSLEQKLFHSLERMSTRTDNLADEETDFGVPPQNVLQRAVGSKTPTKIPGGHVLLLREFRALFAANPRPILIDAWNAERGHYQTIPTAVRIPFAGDFGTFDDDIQQRLIARLDNLTEGNRSTPLVFFCLNSMCWESYNAALRAIHGGFENVYWFRGGNSTWTKGKNDWQSISDEVRLIELRLGEQSSSLRRRWADAVALSETVPILLENAAPMSEVRRLVQRSSDELAALSGVLKSDPNFLRDIADSHMRRSAFLKLTSEPDLVVAAYHYELSLRRAAVDAEPGNASIRSRYIAAFDRLATYQDDNNLRADLAKTQDSILDALQPPGDEVLRAVSGRPNHALWFRSLGEALADDDQTYYAGIAFKKALGIDVARYEGAEQDVAATDLWDDYRLLAELAKQLKNTNSALQWYRSAIEALGNRVRGQPEWPSSKISLASAHQAIAGMHWDKERYVDARAELILALDAASNAVAAGDNLALDKVKSVAKSMGYLAWSLDLAGTFAMALDVAERAVAAAPAEVWINANRAHALMFLGRTDEARHLYLLYRGTTFRGNSWNDDVIGDFNELRQRGHDAPLMREIEQEFASQR